MSSPQGSHEIEKSSPLSVIKIKGTQSPLGFTKFQTSHVDTSMFVASKQPCFSQSFDLSNNPISINRQCHSNRSQKQWSNNLTSSKFYKKEIRTHEKQLRANPRVKLIENTQRLINNERNSSSSVDKYILHSTKRLRLIVADNQNNSSLSQNVQDNKPFEMKIGNGFSRMGNRTDNDNDDGQGFNNKIYGYKKDKNDRNHKSNNRNNSCYYQIVSSSRMSQSFTNNEQEQAKKKSQYHQVQSNQQQRIYKGITSRKSARIGRFSMELQNYKESPQQQNQEMENEFVQHKKIDLYQSLIYGQTNVANTLAMPFSSATGNGDYARIDRTKSPLLSGTDETFYSQRKGRTREKERYHHNSSLANNQGIIAMTAGFPTKKVQQNEPQVLTIHIKRPQNVSKPQSNSLKLRTSLLVPQSTANQQKSSLHYYHPRPLPLSNVNIFKRPNTTLANVRNRRDSEIEPW